MLNNPILLNKLLEQFNSYIHSKTGFIFEQKDLNKLESRIYNRLKHLSINSLEDYYGYLLRNEDELLELINHIIINETTFFRHEDQYFILVDLIKKISEKISSINILSAGCSTGEEPYSIAMFLKTHLNSQIYDRVKISAMDISSFNIKIARRGIYPQLKTDKIKDRNFFKTYFVKTGQEEDYALPDNIKAKVQFSVENLFTVNFKVKFNFIFCRNVMIYFSEEKRNYLLEKFQASLHDSGYFFLAPTESLLDSKNLFERLRENNVTYYKKAQDRQDVEAREKIKPRSIIEKSNISKDKDLTDKERLKEYEIKYIGREGDLIKFECLGIFERKNIDKINSILKNEILIISAKEKFEKIVFLLNKVKYIDAGVLKETGTRLKSALPEIKKLIIISNKEQVMRIFEFHELDGIFEFFQNETEIKR